MKQLYGCKSIVFGFFFSLLSLVGYAQTITTGTISGSPFCTYANATVSVPYTRTGTFTGGNQFRAQLSDPFGSFAAPVTIGSITSVNNGTITATIPAGTISGTGYRIRVVSTTPAIIGSSNTVNLTMNLPAGDPSVFGNGSWNAYAYNGASFSTYFGSYTENNPNFSSATRWANNTSPSNANASSGLSYSGCPIANSATHAVSYKATNFPCGQYQINVLNNDDAGYLLINGTQVWTRPYSNTPVANVWTGFLDPSTTVEFRWINTGGNSNGALDMVASVAGPTVLAPTAGVDCASFTANWIANFNATNYFLDVATDAAFTSILPAYNNLNVGNVASYLVTGLTPGVQYYYRVRAFNAACGLTSGNSNVTSNQVALVSASTVTLCQGESATLTAANATNYSWSPAAGLSATTGPSVVATPTSTTVYTVTGSDALGCSSFTTITVNVNIPSGDPNVFGNDIWNAYSYNGVTKNYYYGFYTENNLSFNATNRWGVNNSPSDANTVSGAAHVGCPNVPVDQHSVSYKRTNFACQPYRMDIVMHDDGATLLVDGAQIWNNNSCCASSPRPDVWRGFLLPTSTVEFWWRDTGGGGSYGRLNLTPAAVPLALPPIAGVSCDQFVANWGTFYNATNYFLDVATDSLFASMVPGYNNLDVGTATSYLVSGLPIGPMYYYRVRAFSSVCGLLTGNSNFATTQVIVSATSLNICEGTSTTLTATNATTYSWSPATGLSATTGSVVVASPAVTTTYTVTGTTAGGCVSSNSFTINVTDSIGNPATFGDGFWNAYCYTLNQTTSTYEYAGRYTENNLSFSSLNRWGNTSSPMSANTTSGLAYSGCTVGADYHSVRYKRTNFPCGTYQIDVPTHDDAAFLLINGVQVWTHNGCCDAHTNVWTGFLSPSSTIEFYWLEGQGGSNGALTITNKEIAVAVAATPGPTSCTEFNANWGAASSATKYYLDVSTSSTFASFVTGYNNLDVGNVTTYLVTGLSMGTQYYYRIRAENPVCGITGNSNTISYTTQNVTAQPGAFVTSSATVCQGQSGVTYSVPAVTGATSYTWTYSGTGATFTNGTTRNPTVAFSATATSGTISVVANNFCGSSVARSMAVTVNVTPAQPAAFVTSTAAVCRPVNNVAYSIAAVPGAVNYTWNYTVGTGATISGGTTTAVTVNYSGSSSSGNLNVRANNGSCSSAYLTMAVTVNTGVPSQPSVITPSTTTPCNNSTGITYTVTSIAGVNYNWSYSGTGASVTSGAGTNSITVNYTAATNGTWSVTPSNACGNGTARTLAVALTTAVPNQPSVITPSVASPCNSSTGITYTVTNVAGVTYAWSYSGTGASITAGATSNAITVSYTGATDGTWTVTPSNSCGSGTTRTLAVTVVSGAPAQPSVITPSNATPCATSTGNTYSVTNVAGVSYAWSYSGTGSSVTAGTGTNAITVSYTSATAGTWTVTPSNGCGNGTTRTLAVTFQAIGVWNGSVSTAWSSTSNWSCGTLPTSSIDVTIPGGATNMPTNTGTANMRNLTISPTASLTNSATGTLNVFGNFTNSGTYSDNGFTVFTGSTPQNLNGATTLHSVIVNNTAGVTLNNATYVKGHLTLTAGTLASGGNLTVDLNTGAITGAGAGSISGNITVLKWIWGDKYHYISSPLSGRTVTEWNDDVLIKFGANSNLYNYNETVANIDKEVGWTAVTNAATAIQDMKGYALYFPRGVYKTTLDLTGPYTHNQTYTNAGLTNTISGQPLSDGWNLVGNPYPCVIDWDAASGWTKTGLDNAIYFWDPKNNRYASYVAGIGVNGGTRYIPAMQGFYVVVSTPGGTGTLGMNNNVRTTASNPDVWRVASEERIIRLKADNGSVSDETVIRFSDQATEQFDAQFDAHKIPSSGTTPSISTKMGAVNYVVNSIPDTTSYKTIPVPVMVGLTGTYNIAADITGFDREDSIVLEDRLLGVYQDLTSNPVYAGNLTKGDTSTRFFIHYKKAAKVDVVTDVYNAVDMQEIGIYGLEQTVTVTFNNQNNTDAAIAIYDIKGTLVYQVDNADVSSGGAIITLPQIKSGVYIVKVQTSSTTKTQKVFLSK